MRAISDVHAGRRFPASDLVHRISVEGELRLLREDFCQPFLRLDLLPGNARRKNNIFEDNLPRYFQGLRIGQCNAFGITGKLSA